jgi:aspartate oxidase
LLNSKGERFVNELGRRDDVTAAILEQANARAFLVLDDAEGGLAFGKPFLGFYKSKGLVRVANNFAELTAIIAGDGDAAVANDDVDANVATALNTYRASCAAGADAFGKVTFPSANYGTDDKHFPVHIIVITPAVHYTMGGVAIDTQSRVLDADGAVLNGLWAAGEVSGGVHGVNRLAGNSLAECVVFGRRAAKSIAAALSGGGVGGGAAAVGDAKDEL